MVNDKSYEHVKDFVLEEAIQHVDFPDHHYANFTLILDSHICNITNSFLAYNVKNFLISFSYSVVTLDSRRRPHTDHL